MLRVFIITQEEPFFIPKMIGHLLKETEKNDSIEIVGATILKPHRKNKNMFHWIRERTKIYSLFELGIVGTAFLGAKINSAIFPKKSTHSVRKRFKEKGIKVFETKDINSEIFVSTIKDLDTDVIVSISCPQIFSDELLNSVNKICVNTHGTLLPRHRGVFGTWWTLFSGDREGGSTIHTMVDKLDAGKIIWQKSFPLQKSNTQYSLAYKTKRDMAKGLIEVLTDIQNDSLNIIQPDHVTTYNRAPDKKLGKIFYKKGYKVIRIKDLKFLFSKSYE